MKAFFDPRFFNCLIMSLYLLCAIRWACDKKWVDVAYWMCALGITATVTFGYKR